MSTLVRWRRTSIYERILIAIFLISLPFVNPWVRGDGVGYYAYARALVVSHNLQFESDWRHANLSFREGRVDANGRVHQDQYTATGHLDNHFAIGPALLWIPFLTLTHVTVLAADRFGAHISANGFSWPYLDTMAVVTAVAGFLGLLISFRLAGKYFPERWTFLATLGIWFASSLPVYMYFNPSWSHDQSAFVIALFLWYWDRTRMERTSRQWLILGMISGLMVDMYYPNAVFLFVIVVEFAFHSAYSRKSGTSIKEAVSQFTRHYALFTGALLLAFSPSLITRRIIYGSFFSSGYPGSLWHVTSPVWTSVLFSADHGLFSWTPALLIACAGLPFLYKRDRTLGTAVAASAFAFYCLIAVYVDWDGISSYGNRFFISLSPIFILGLAALLTAYEKLLRRTRAAVASAAIVLALLSAWNFGFIFQWGMQLIPDRGPISWSTMIFNQFHVVPAKLVDSATHYLVERHQLMQTIEKKDLRQLGEADTSPHNVVPQK